MADPELAPPHAAPEQGEPSKHGTERNPAGHDRRTLTRIEALEKPNDVLNRVAAGVRAATLCKVLFDDAEAAIILGVSTETLKVWRRDGGGPVWVRLGNSKLVRYPLAALYEYVAKLC
jgi:hypothetical protein